MRQSLTGGWQFRMERDTHWRDIEVPDCWESLGLPKDDPGPGLYRREVEIPADWAGQRIWLCFAAVSYACRIEVNGQLAGEHLGAWDAFRLEITRFVKPGARAEVLVRVEKPASLTAGPYTPPVPGAFPQNETLSGFLPYVWGHMFGGIWQESWLEATGRVVIEDLCIRADHAGNIRGEVRLSEPAEVELELIDPEGKPVLSARQEGREVLFIEKLMPPRPWSLADPALYEAVVRAGGSDGETRRQKVGMRSIRADGPAIMLNDAPVYPRMILSWGWYEQSLCANPGPEQVRRDFERLRSLGYNGVKLCLWVPPRYYFDVADETGMLLWLELPMWMPKITPFFLEQTPLEYERIVRQVRHHPSLVLYTLGCELDAKVRADFLEPLYRRTKALIGDALLRDNSGSGEAYGGLLNEFAEYYDYHFYSDIQFFRPLLDAFAPRWRPRQPFLFGEFCDSDTWRDLRKLHATGGGELPWWARDDANENPKGARWQHDVSVIEPRLREHGLWDRQDELEQVSCKQALLHRKFTLEMVRTYGEISGYVVTGERDTPISKAGMWTGVSEGEERPKFDADSFAAFNSDVVLALGWDKRRAWIHGGDRIAPWDTFGHVAGESMRAHVIAANHGAAAEGVEGTWGVELAANGAAKRIAAGEFEQEAPFASGAVREVTIAEFAVPQIDRPTRARLQVETRLGETAARNQWPLWFFPAPPADLPVVHVFDPAGRLDALGPWLRAAGTREGGASAGPAHEAAGMARIGFASAASTIASSRQASASAPIVATEWDDELARFVEDGGRAILLQPGGGPPGPLPTAPMPFWREGIKLIEPHPAWGDFPHEGFCDLQFFGMATDFALDSAKQANARPILRRVDARTAAVHDYAVELGLGSGRLIVTTLRFEGGLGEQPLGLSRNTCAAYLLSCWVRYLADLPRS